MSYALAKSSSALPTVLSMATSSLRFSRRKWADEVADVDPHARKILID